MKHVVSCNIDTGDVVLYDDEANTLTKIRAGKLKSELNWSKE